MIRQRDVVEDIDYYYDNQYSTTTSTLQSSSFTAVPSSSSANGCLSSCSPSDSVLVGGDVGGGSGGDFKKRIRRFSVDEEVDSEGVINRCLTFLINLHPSSRPKTHEKLSRALQHVCTCNYKLDVNVIYFHLLINQIILPVAPPTSSHHPHHHSHHHHHGNSPDSIVEDEEEVNNEVLYVTVNPDPPSRVGNQYLVAIPSNTTGLFSSDRVSNDFREVLRKSVMWAQGNRGLQGKVVARDSFLKALEQVCVLKRVADPELVVLHLLKRGMVYIEGDGSVVYYLPVSSPASHFMAMVESN